MRNSIVTLTFLSFFLAAPAWSDDPPSAPEIANRCDLDCFRGFMQAYAEQHNVNIPRADVTQRFQEADANGNGILGRAERERLVNELPGFFRPYFGGGSNDDRPTVGPGGRAANPDFSGGAEAQEVRSRGDARIITDTADPIGNAHDIDPNNDD
jgi:hypothetical protein